jgi:exodeoxyribonuclease V gamma subunit
LADVTARVPEDPLAPEWICIQSRGMKQWISLELARIRGISARLKFLFPADLILYFLDRHPDEPVLDVDALVWAVYARLDDPDPDGLLAPLASYFKSDDTGKKKIQLAQKIATVLDDYQVYRPDMLVNWETYGTLLHPENTDEIWQSRLWQNIVSDSRATSFPGQMNALIAAALEKKLPDLPHQICLFGLSSVPPSFMNVFSALDTDVFVFLLTPSNQYFFDMVSPGQMDRMALKNRGTSGTDPEEAYWEISHPLLASLGRSSRQFMQLLETEPYLEPFDDLFVDPASEAVADAGPVSMLSCLQSDILNLTFRHPEKDVPPFAVSLDDTSIQVHACHSPMREAQVLKDLLLDTLARDSTIAPHDMIVMMPDIEAYAPFIEAVFSREPAIPFSISDRRHKTESPTIEAFLKIFAMKGSRMAQSDVMDLLQCPVIAETFDIAPGDIRELTDMVHRSGILWGMDPDHRRDLTGKGFKENTWQFGFERLFLGIAMPAAQETLVNDVLPCPFAEGTNAAILGQFTHFCHTLFRHLNTLDAQYTPGQWEQFFTALIQEMMTPDLEREPDFRFLYQVCQDLTRAADIAGFTGNIGFYAARDLVENKLDQTVSRGGFMTGAVTFCNLVPMRSIPFKVVALMGMDEAAFPRKMIPKSFDLMAAYPRPGDKNMRDEDRTLFLETVLSARNRLIITYTGMGIQDNAPLPCSGVVSELADVIHTGFVFPSGYQWWITHRLHPFNPAYFDGNPGLFSYSEEQCRIARSRTHRRSDTPRRLSADMDRSGAMDQASDLPGPVSEPDTVSLQTLCRFFNHPLAMFYQTTPKIVFPVLQEPLPDREPFQVSGLARYQLGSWILEKELNLSGYPLARAGGQLPLGNQGGLAWEHLLEITRPIQALAEQQVPDTPRDSVAVDLVVKKCRIQGLMSDLYQEDKGAVRCVIEFGRIHARRLVTNWILHLAATLMMPNTPVTTRIIGTDPFRRQSVGMQTFTPVGESARTYLEHLVTLYCQGLTRPWPFFPDTGLALARALAEKEYDPHDDVLAGAMKKARPVWFNAHTQTGEKTDRYTAMWMENHPDPLDTLLHLQTSGIVDHSLAVFKPLLAHLESGA